jgi:hypothetical protein
LFQSIKNGGIIEPTNYHAIDLVKWIRALEAKKKNYQDDGLTVAVAGHIFPPDKDITYQECMEHLK